MIALRLLAVRCETVAEWLSDAMASGAPDRWLTSQACIALWEIAAVARQEAEQ